MKLNLLTFIFLFIFAIGSAQDYSVSNVVCDPPSPDTLMPNERVNITFDYTKAGGDIRIYIMPYKTGGIGSGFWGGSPLYSDNSGNGESYFGFKNGATITGIRFRFKDVDGTLLYDTVVPVSFIYHEFNITDLELTPTSPSVLKIGDSINFSFNYKKPDMDVLIVPSGISNDNVASKQTTSTSPTYTDTTGAGNGFIKIDTLATVDEIRFQFIDAVTNDTIAEIFKNVYYSFTNDSNKTYSISNVVYDPTSPGSLVANDKVNITFDYQKPYGDVRIYVQPLKSSGSGNTGVSGSGIYSESNGSGDAYFTYYGEALIEQVRIRIQSVNGGIVLHDHIEDVHFSYSLNPTAYSISNVVFTPTSPDTIHTVDTLKFTFDYVKPFGDVKIFARPMKDGEVKLGFTSKTVTTYKDDTGSGWDYISFADIASFDQIRFQIKSTLNQLLYETIIDVDYTFIQRPVSSEIIENDGELKIYPNPSNGKLTIYIPSEKGFKYSIINLSGQTILEGISNANTLNLNTKYIKSGTYIAKIKVDEKQFSKLVVFE